MLKPEDLEFVMNKWHAMSRTERQTRRKVIQNGMNAHPGGQMTMNVPWMDGKRMDGMQHKYTETLLFFPNVV